MKTYLVFNYKGEKKEKRVLIASEVKEDTSILGTKRLLAEKSKEFYKEKLGWVFDGMTKEQNKDFIKHMVWSVTEESEVSLNNMKEDCGVEIIFIEDKKRQVRNKKTVEINVKTFVYPYIETKKMEEYKTKINEFKDFKLFIRKDEKTGHYLVTEAYTGGLLVDSKHKKDIEIYLQDMVGKIEKLKQLISESENLNPKIVDEEYIKKLTVQEKKEYSKVELTKDCTEIKSYLFAKMVFEVVSENRRNFKILVGDKTYEIPREKAVIIKEGRDTIIEKQDCEEKMIKEKDESKNKVINYFKTIEKLDKKITELRDEMEKETNELKYDHYKTNCESLIDTKCFIQEFFENNPKEINKVLDYTVISKGKHFGKNYYLIEHNIYGEEDCKIVSAGKILESSWYDSLESYLIERLE